MSLNIISNFAANVAHRNLVMSDAAATSSLAKLSAGTRVLSAKDDAASLAIGSRLRAEVAAMQQASQNTSQAASMLQIADGALGTISDILVRMKSLAVQASSGQFGAIERAVLDSEYQALSLEITRISADTEFNGTQLISGGAAVFNADGVTSTVNDQTLESDTGGLAAAGISIAYDTALVTSGDTFQVSFDQTGTPDNLTVTNTRTGDQQTIDIETIFETAAVAGGGTTADNTLASGTTLAVNFTQLGVTLTLDSAFDRSADIAAAGPTLGVAGNITLNGPTFTAATSGIDNTALQALVALDSGAAFDLATGILSIAVTTTGSGNAVLDPEAGLRLTVDGAAQLADGVASADLDDGNFHSVAISLTTGNVNLGTVAFTTIVAAAGGGAGRIDIDLGDLFGTSFTAGTTSQNFTFKVGTGSASQDSLTFTVAAASASNLGVASTVITDAVSADAASALVSSAIDTVNQQRATIGAAQNRLQFASNNLASAIENAESARSSLLDLDIAKEISEFTNKQVLVQTGIAMLAQANTVPQNLLRLLQ